MGDDDKYERWKAIPTHDVTGEQDPDSLRKALENARDLYCGYKCGKCGKKLVEGEGHHLIIDWEEQPFPGIGWVRMPARVSDFRYCTKCWAEKMKNGKGSHLRLIDGGK